MKNLIVCGILLLSIFNSKFSFGQDCPDGTTVNFGYGVSNLSKEGKVTLDSLAAFLKKADNGYLELSGHTDTKGSDEYNMKLSGIRLKSVTTYLLKAGSKKLDIQTFNFGESRPVNANDSTDELRAQNRRVEIFYYPIVDGKIILTANNGLSYSLDKSTFSACGLCASGGTTVEMHPGISAVTPDGSKVNMKDVFRIKFNCADKKESCLTLLTIPSPSYNADFQLWTSVSDEPGNWTLKSDKIQYDETNKQYIINEKFCENTWVGIGNKTAAMDKISVVVPFLFRNNQFAPYLGEREWLDISNITDSSFVTSCKECTQSVNLNDTGYLENGYTYTYNGLLNPGFIKNENGVSYYRLTLNDYKPLVKYSDSTLLIKMPKKYAKHVKMHLTGIDSFMNMRRFEKKENKFRVRKPSHDYEITFQRSKDEKFYVPEENLRFKYKKKKKLYYAKIKSGDIKEL